MLFRFLTTTVWIQIAGASLLSGPDIATQAYGQARPQQNHNDLQGIDEIRNIVTSSPKRAVDNLLLNLSTTQPHVRTAIVYGPLIYGLGRGPGNQRSIQVPDLARETLRHGHGVQVGRGQSCWNNVHVSDLARLVVRLVQEATAHSHSDSLLWNENGIYLAENGKLVRCPSPLVPRFHFLTFFIAIWRNLETSGLICFRAGFYQKPNCPGYRCGYS